MQAEMHYIRSKVLEDEPDPTDQVFLFSSPIVLL